jgi:hypothetical protein
MYVRIPGRPRPRANTGGQSVRWMLVVNPGATGNDTTDPPNNPAGVIVDMGAYENYGPSDGGGGPGGQ